MELQVLISVPGTGKFPTRLVNAAMLVLALYGI